ncbi:DUF1707 SHOCT-like domain-containing protein [Saccharothrix coeruleofusca]|uniref:DUF1707 domain-containing protein n=1 Tax=Saccharothrix coeruleofusca TaxID=33919 RepID=A0A918EF51_9PSEU|nr:DUF1707 domain-containing protein [Saccharothrix coeruleofusca]GGP70366.1 hypothetical protein GCM10010185_49270 [Saccharothrix coeruleofusca]
MDERDIRIGDAERAQALELLGEHLGEGRLDVEEYGERSARVSTARTRGELMALFADLPPPRPRFQQVAPLSTAQPPVRRSFRPDPRVVVPLVVLACVGLWALVRIPQVLLLIPVAVLLLGGMGRRR